MATNSGLSYLLPLNYLFFCLSPLPTAEGSCCCCGFPWKCSLPILPLFLLQRQHNYSYYCKFRYCCLASSGSSSYYLTSASCRLSFLSLSSRQLKSICFASHSLESESRRTLYATPNWPRPAAAAAIPAATAMAAATEKAPTAVFADGTQKLLLLQLQQRWRTAC